MGHAKRNKLVFTVKDRCRVCYTCLRECPVKAIKIINGQAEVISERCIGCGNCVSVCSQKAKVYFDSVERVENMLQSEPEIVACIAPSFPAEFSEIPDHKFLVGMIKKLGFHRVFEVAFGADLVAKEYSKLIESAGEKTYISSDCPAIVFYIEHYYPELIKNLAPIASPMVAICRVIRKKYGENTKVVFIGPCIAKKAESDEIDEALTFIELRTLFERNAITVENADPSEFDSPHPGKGAIFPVSRGLLQSVNIKDDIIKGEILVASGRINFREAIKEFDNKEIEAKHLELLCCDGCIMGPGMSQCGKPYHRRVRISNYVKSRLEVLDNEKWSEEMNEYNDIVLSQTFNPADRRQEKPAYDMVEKILLSMGKNDTKDHLNCGACGYDTCIEHAEAILLGHAENEMCLPFAIEKLHKSVNALNISNENLANAKLALKQSEKLASMGQLSAGIAHELNNPLGVITLYSNILKDEISADSPVQKDLQLIVEQSERCKKIVGGLLNFARKNQVKLVETDFEKFVHHSIESVIIPGNVQVEIKSSLVDKMVMIDTDQMMQVLTNLEKNAVEAMPAGGNLTIEITGDKQSVEIAINDSGTGIPKENMEKLFEPFFTTKEPGKGTGLGLPLVYGIVKMHKGQINVVSNTLPENGPVGTTFKIVLPRYN
ncbi:MAG: histidine kinase [Bacteroidetes bacterium GWF2_38_335]|nr:MAG: histidine kinase [Bacteroidetes bacterium GWF2_38_335]OFY81185.1 MAG: histidine kinase [Bacteroidetes bacterium RIFOXYA12_FULL_38_20]HBS85300.1 histidine kinase [Bacteroidales bacterium]